MAYTNTRKLVGIDSKVIEHTTYKGQELITFVTQAPKFCLTGDTLLHFERWQIKEVQPCLATMSLEEFHDKWLNGVTKTVNLDKRYKQLEDDKEYSLPDIAQTNNKTPEAIYHLRKIYEDFPKGDVLTGKEFNEFINSTKTFKSDYKSILKGMRLRTMNTTTNRYETTHVKDVWISGEKEVFELSAGSMTIKASANHPFYTQRGWVKLGELDINTDKVYMINHTGRGTTPVDYSSFNRAMKDTLIHIQNKKCKDCDKPIDSKCDVHHIKPVIEFPEFAFDSNNVVALCQKCHTQRHIDLYSGSLKPTLHTISSITSVGVELTYDLEVEHYDHNYVANGFVVHNCDAEIEKHRMFSSNSSSDRAIPFLKMVDKPYFTPTDLRLEQAGMQGFTVADEVLTSEFNWDMSEIRDNVIATLELYPEIHKQHKNRYLLPWSYQTKIITTNVHWFNYFTLLRDAPGADPAIQQLAKAMREAYIWSQPRVIEYGEWHLPFVTKEELNTYTLIDCQHMSVARCARISYGNHDGTANSLDKDNGLFTKLYVEKHRTPMEHQATPMLRIQVEPNALTWEPGVTHINKFNQKFSGNFQGYIQYRQLL